MFHTSQSKLTLLALTTIFWALPLLAHDSKPIMKEYFHFKEKLAKDHGFAFGFDYFTLALASTESLKENIATGGVFRTHGQWTLIGQNAEEKDSGTLVYKIENRHKLGTYSTPKNFGNDIGYAGLLATTFSDAHWIVTNLFWNQKFLDNHMNVMAGIVDLTDYLDNYGLANVWTDFNNCVFTNSPVMPIPAQGLGAGLFFLPTNTIYVLGGFGDANSDPTHPEKCFNSFFNDAEFFTHLEVGWISSWEKRFDDNIHVVVWHADERKKARSKAGYGLSFSACRLIATSWEPFIRAGWAKDGGALCDMEVSIGIGYHIKKNIDLLGLGLSWGKPSVSTYGPKLKDQYSVEAFCRFHIVKIVTITPAIQLLFNPALNQNKNMTTVFAIRAQVSI